MSGLFSALQTTAQALRVLDRNIATTQNNVNNLQTVGYAKQQVAAAALPFNLTTGFPGGVVGLGAVSSRSHIAELGVRGSLSDAESAKSQSMMLGMLEGVLPPDATKGLGGALNALWESFSSWSAAPSSKTARDGVMAAAAGFAASLNQVAGQAGEIRRSTDQLAESSVTAINAITQRIAQLNARIEHSGTDAGLDANLHASLEELSAEVGVSVVWNQNGTATVLMGGQAPLVDSTGSHELRMTLAPQGPNAPPRLSIRAENGEDLTHLAVSGTLGGLVDFRNGALATFEGDGTQPGSLNRLAANVADRVNQLLSSGFSTLDPVPIGGVPLFDYASLQNAALSMQVSSAATGDGLAAMTQGPPVSSNGIALQLAGLRDSSDSINQIDGRNYTDYYAAMVSGAGAQAKAADSITSMAEDRLLQSKNLRDQLSGVSLDEEAARLLEFQRSYQANARLIQVVSELTATLINSVR